MNHAGHGSPLNVQRDRVVREATALKSPGPYLYGQKHTSTDEDEMRGVATCGFHAAAESAEVLGQEASRLLGADRRDRPLDRWCVSQLRKQSVAIPGR